MWFKSVSKSVFFLMAFTVCYAFIIGVLPVDDFMKLALMAFTFYFSIRQVTKNDRET